MNIPYFETRFMIKIGHSSKPISSIIVNIIIHILMSYNIIVSLS